MDLRTGIFFFLLQENTNSQDVDFRIPVTISALTSKGPLAHFQPVGEKSPTQSILLDPVAGENRLSFLQKHLNNSIPVLVL